MNLSLRNSRSQPNLQSSDLESSQTTASALSLFSSTSSTTTTSTSTHPSTSNSTRRSMKTPFPIALSISFSFLLFTLALLVQPILASPFPNPFSAETLDHQSQSHSKRAIVFNQTEAEDGQKLDFYSPINSTLEGQMLTIIPGPYAIGLGEPLNAIVSANSDAEVLTVEGFLLWATSINFGVSCLGQANGTLQLTSLGDGKLNRTQGNGDGNNGVLRYNFGSPFIGTCRETFSGGNHFRWWIQNGTEANSGAYFLAASAELPLDQNHLIMPDGYNKGRDELIGNATLPNGTNYGDHYFNTTVEWIEAGILLNATSEKINHANEVAVNGNPAQDGRVAVMTVRYLSGPRKVQDQSNGAGLGLGEPSLAIMAACLIALLPVLLI